MILTNKELSARAFMQALSGPTIGLLLFLFSYVYMGYSFVEFMNATLLEDKLAIQDIATGATNFFIFNALIYLIFNKVSLFSLGLSLSLGLFAGAINFFEGHVYPFFFSIGLTDGMNPQYSKVIVIFSVLGLLLLKTIVSLLIAKRSTFVGIFTTLTIVVLILTTFIFHRVTAQGGLKDLQHANKELLNSYMFLDESNIKKICADKKLYCLIKKPGANPFETNEGPFNVSFILKRISFSKEKKFTQGFEFVKLKNDGEERNIFVEYQAFHIHKDNGTKILIGDINGPRSFTEKNLVYFYFLSFCVSFFWMHLYLLMLLFHRKRKYFKLP